MRVLQVSVALDKRFGGPPKAILGLAKSLSGISDNYVKIISVGNTKSLVKENVAQGRFQFDFGNSLEIVLTHALFPNKYGIGSWRELVRTIFKEEFDVIVVHQIYTIPGILVYLSTRIRKVPYVIMPHGSLEPYHEKFHSRRKWIIRKLIINRLIKSSEAIFVAHKSELMHLDPKYQAKSIMVGLGVATKEQPIERSFDPSNLKLLYVGRITEKKRLDLIIDAIALHSREESEFSLTLSIAGDGEDSKMNEIKKLVSIRNLEKCVNFYGWVDGEKLQTLFLDSDIYIHISENENFSISVAEAINYNLPIVLSKEVALSSIVSEFQLGIVVEELSPTAVLEALKQMTLERLDVFSRNSNTAKREISWENVSSAWDKQLSHVINDFKGSKVLKK
jgi:glycosyltransferase involved in cell wall biosynthesis